MLQHNPASSNVADIKKMFERVLHGDLSKQEARLFFDFARKFSFLARRKASSKESGGTSWNFEGKKHYGFLLVWAKKLVDSSDNEEDEQQKHSTSLAAVLREELVARHLRLLPEVRYSDDSQQHDLSRDAVAQFLPTTWNFGKSVQQAFELFLPIAGLTFVVAALTKNPSGFRSDSWSGR